MKIEIVNERNNMLLERQELYMNVSAAEPIKREDLINELSKLKKVDKNCIVISKINYQYGTSTSKCYAKIYKSPEQLKFIEPKHILIRNKIIAGEKKKSG